MSTIPQLPHDFQLSLRHFTKLVHLNSILRQANIYKNRGIRVTVLFEWLLTATFSRYSIFRAHQDPRFTKKTVRNCLNDPHTNWQRLVILIAYRLVTYVQHFTDDKRRQAFILDDSLFKRQFSQHTELLARVFDHDKQVYLKGFRALTLGWSDGNTFLPVDFSLVSSSKQQNVLGPEKRFDARSLAAKRRRQAQRKLNDVGLELLDAAQKNGFTSKYVLFDSWFTSPHMFAELLKRHLFGVGMLKRSKKVYFRYRGRQMDVKTLYENLRRSKWPHHENYLYSPLVKFQVGDQEMPVKLVYIVDRNVADQYLVLGTTKTSLRPEEIIQLYARRWQIENYFKVAKQYLQFDQTQIQNYDGLCGHMAMVMMSYDILALVQRETIDERTMGDLFFYLGEPLPDIQLVEALSWLIKQLNGLVKNSVLDDNIINELFTSFMQTLPRNLERLLGNVA